MSFTEVCIDISLSICEEDASCNVVLGEKGNRLNPRVLPASVLLRKWMIYVVRRLEVDQPMP